MCFSFFGARGEVFKSPSVYEIVIAARGVFRVYRSRVDATTFMNLWRTIVRAQLEMISAMIFRNIARACDSRGDIAVSAI